MRGGLGRLGANLAGGWHLHHACVRAPPFERIDRGDAAPPPRGGRAMSVRMRVRRRHGAVAQTAEPETTSLLRSGRVAEFLAYAKLYPTLQSTAQNDSFLHPVALAMPRIVVHSAASAQTGVHHIAGYSRPPPSPTS